MQNFTKCYAKEIVGTLSGWDRVVIRGHLRAIIYPEGMKYYLGRNGVLLKEFGSFVNKVSQRVKQAATTMMAAVGCPICYLPSAKTSKEEFIREILRKRKIKSGDVAMLSSVEPCQTYEIYRNRQTRHLELQSRLRKCLFLYRYMIDPEWGLMHMRIQTWFPFTVQVCLNGREWLARQLDQAGIGYQRRDNAFVAFEDWDEAQRLCEAQMRIRWPEKLNGLIPMINPLHEELFPGLSYYWSVYQSEYATDVVFRDCAALGRYYPLFVRHAITHFASPDIMRFLGYHVPLSGNVNGHFKGTVTSDLKTRPEGIRVKHAVNHNSLKMYDKQGQILRVETTINDVRGLKIYRPQTKRRGRKAWQQMRRGIADIQRRAQVSRAANHRYFDALSAVDTDAPCKNLTDPLCRPIQWHGRRVRGLNPFAEPDVTILKAINRGEFLLNGFRNRDLRRIIFGADSRDPRENRRQGARITYLLRILRAHGLINKVSHTNRYLVTDRGRQAITTLLDIRETSLRKLNNIAA